MQPRPGNTAILCGRKNDQEFPGPDVCGRKNPLSQVGGINGQRPTGQINCVCTSIIEFDPIAELAILVLEAVRRNIRSEKFVDDHVGRGCVRVERECPATACKWISSQIGNPMSAVPRDIDGPLGGFWKTEQV